MTMVTMEVYIKFFLNITHFWHLYKLDLPAGQRIYLDPLKPGCGAYLHFTDLEPAVGLRPALWTVDLFHNLPLVPGFYTGTAEWQMHMGMTENMPSYPTERRPGVELATMRSRIKRPNH